jgi:F0F1-type ATP synthase delta subunit
MNENIVARTYARAYMRVFGKELPDDFLHKIQELQLFFKDHREALFYIKISLIPQLIKQQVLLRLCERYGLTIGISQLLTLLANHKRLYLMNKIVNALGEEYKRVQGIESFTVSAAHDLSDDQINEIRTALAQLIRGKVAITIVRDESLIAGFRAISRNYKWEYSVRQLLRRMLST